MGTPAQTILEIIEKNRRNPMVLATPLGTLLPAIKQWVIDTETRLEALERTNGEAT